MRLYSADYLTDLLMNTEDKAERYRKALQEIARCAEGGAPGWRDLVDIAREALKEAA